MTSQRRGEKVRTAIWKQPVPGQGHSRPLECRRRWTRRSRWAWRREPRRHGLSDGGLTTTGKPNFLRGDFSFGQFGENFTVAGLPDDEVCIGDRYRIGTALFEVSQPRVTCYRVGIRMAEPAMAALLVSHHRPGFYFRVIEEGEVGSGDEIVKVADGPERITVADIDALLYLPNPSREQLQRSLRVPALSQGWKTSLKALVEQNGTESEGIEAQGFKRSAARMARFSDVARRDSRSGGRRCGLVVHRTN